jgi:dephospho-CoA kinase
MSFILGLTGGIGSGKSAASHWFEQQGIQVVDADVVAREIVAVGQPALQQIRSSFGEWALLDNGELNRRALREHIFQDPSARKQLEKITHPAIRQSIMQQLQAATSPAVVPRRSRKRVSRFRCDSRFFAWVSVRESSASLNPFWKSAMSFITLSADASFVSAALF